MNKYELKVKLDELGISSKNYSLDGTLKPVRIILLFSEFKWWTFEYDEHGNIEAKKQFETEDEACQDMLRRLINLKEWRKKHNLKDH